MQIAAVYHCSNADADDYTLERFGALEDTGLLHVLSRPPKSGLSIEEVTDKIRGTKTTYVRLRSHSAGDLADTNILRTIGRVLRRHSISARQRKSTRSIDT